MYRITDTVKHLLIINVLVYFGTLLLGPQRYALAVYFPTSEFFRPYQIVTHMFMHGNLTHLFFNMFGLFMFGPPLESIWGPKRFLGYYLITGFGALGLHLLATYIEIQMDPGMASTINVPMLGASGAIFGLLAGFGMIFPNATIMLLFPPIPIKAKYFVLIYAAIEFFLGVSNPNGGVAHFAHVGGALFGVLLVLYWRYKR
ncbi:MAG: rhomboid family intramembrane serine protease [Lewinellaceae bacterium]|nr:rhomboid family intramembrane serine protease [Lewinellaceae bacterium]